MRRRNAHERPDGSRSPAPSFGLARAAAFHPPRHGWTRGRSVRRLPRRASQGRAPPPAGFRDRRSSWVESRPHRSSRRRRRSGLPLRTAACALRARQLPEAASDPTTSAGRTSRGGPRRRVFESGLEVKFQRGEHDQGVRVIDIAREMALPQAPHAFRVDEVPSREVLDAITDDGAQIGACPGRLRRRPGS